MSQPFPPPLARREVLQLAALAGAASWLPGCGGTKHAGSSDTAGGADPSSPLESAVVDTADTGTGGGDYGGWTWARGGTVGMTNPDSYPDPFTLPITTCTVLPTTTAGPCTTATDLARRDISEGWRGLPVRLALRIVDASCQPLAGARVRVWHTNVEGSYSGQTPNNRMCLQDQGYASVDFFRGVQDTDDAGVVRFDTCFPGAYPGRAIHVHFQVVVEGVSTDVSQLFFPASLTDAVFAEHPDYVAPGAPDTSLATDGIARSLGTIALAQLTLDVAYMRDGAILASKTLSVRA
jgi:hypothetical protein